MPRALLILGTASLLIAAAQASDPGPPAWVEVDPNAIQNAGQPMQIDIGGIPQGQTVTLQVLQDCNGDHRPDLRGQGDCQEPPGCKGQPPGGLTEQGRGLSRFHRPGKERHLPAAESGALAARLPVGLAAGVRRSSAGRRSVHSSGRPRWRSSASAHAARAPWPRRCAATAALSASKRRRSR